MALGFNVQGPCLLKVGPGDTAYDNAASKSIGYSSNDDLFTYEVDVRNHILESTDHGREPGEIVYVGAVALVTATLTKWDLTEFAAGIFPLPGGTDEGDAGVIGTRWVTGSACLAVVIDPIGTGLNAYRFPRCFLDGNSIRVFDHGNDSQKLGLQFVAFRSSGTINTLGDGADGTENFYTVHTTA